MVKFLFPGYKELGKKVIQESSYILEKENMNWFLGSGTLLGVIRNNDFIDYDTDVDFDLPFLEKKEILNIRDKLSEILPYEGLRTYNDRIQMIMFRTHKMRVDFHIWHRKDDYAYRVDKGDISKYGHEHIFYKIPVDVFKEHGYIMFKGIKCRIPKYPEMYLESFVDKEWKVPKVPPHEYHTKINSPAIIPKEQYPF